MTRMRVQSWDQPLAAGEKVPPLDVLAFDLELANSFRGRRGVICMVGIGYCVQTTPAERNPAAGGAPPGRIDREGTAPGGTAPGDAGIALRVTIASSTLRSEEPQLLRWFLDEVQRFAEAHDTPQLLSFAGLDNDIPWILHRLESAEEREMLGSLAHLDLKRAFEERTHAESISLKRLELLFGIQRQANLDSREVSFRLTALLRREEANASLPEGLLTYLREDVLHLLHIVARWEAIDLTPHRLSDRLYLGKLNSLASLAQRLLEDGRRVGAADREALQVFLNRLTPAWERLLIHGDFTAFEVPALPRLVGQHRDVQRLLRKHRRLRAIPLTEGEQKRPFLRPEPKKEGALAVVQRDGRLLMIQRALDLQRAPGQWGLPGGLLEPGETPAQAALRELEEELGLKGRSRTALGSSWSLSGEYCLHWIPIEIDAAAQPKAYPDEVHRWRWVNAAEISTLHPLVPGARLGCAHFLRATFGEDSIVSPHELRKLHLAAQG